MSAKYQLLAQTLRQELLRKGPHSYKLPTEQELSDRYNLSRQTVRHALALLTQEGLIERRQGSGSFSTGRGANTPRQIAVVATFLDDYIFPTILHDAQAVFSREGYSTLVFATENEVGTERSILQQLLTQPVAGILVEGCKTALPNPNLQLYQQLLGSGTPMLFLHGACAELKTVPCISDDNYAGGYLLARHLLAKGHREIAGIFKSDDLQGPQRYHGCVSAIRDAGLTLHDRNFLWFDTQDRLEMVSLNDISLLRRFLDVRLDGATAVICYNDEIAFLLIRELLARGRRVPEDVAVVSFDNSYYSQISPVPITSLRHPMGRMGQVAAEQLLRELHGENAGSRALSWELVERASG